MDSLDMDEVPNLRRNNSGRHNRSKEEAPLNFENSRHISEPNCSENALQHFESFGKNASIDGLKFLTEKGRTLTERIFWAIVLTICLILCIYLVIKTFEKWISSPVIVSFATSQTLIFNIPFPAVTICPEVKTNKNIFNYTDVYLRKENNQSVSPEEAKYFEFMALYCDTPSNLVQEDFFKDDEAMMNFFISATLDLSDQILALRWRGKDSVDNATSLFTPILTSQGVCFTFNLLDRNDLFTDIVSYHNNFFLSNRTSSEWSLERGYANDVFLNEYPRRTLTAGIEGGLSITLGVPKEHLDYACGDSLQGYKVTIHTPTELPSVEDNYFRLPLDQVILAAVKPEMIQTSENLKSYRTEDRKCYFKSERTLTFFKIYNQKNCLIECLSNFTLSYCECVSFYMPRQNSTPICGPSANTTTCLQEAEDIFLLGEFTYEAIKSNLTKSLTNDLSDIRLGVCNCLPACESLEYNVEISQSNWNWKQKAKIDLKTHGEEKEGARFFINNSYHLTQMMIFFKDMQFIPLKREELYSYVDFWANVGGTVGLFTGFSFVTVFEIFYYLSLRVCCNIRLFGLSYWSGSPELG